jgi:hypothetical protein
VDRKLDVDPGEELPTKDNVVVPKGGNKKRKITELAAVNLESELDPRGDRLAWLSVKAINGDGLIKGVDRNTTSPD